MNPYYFPRGEPPLMRVLSLAQVALSAYNAGLLGGEPARMAKARREWYETETDVAKREHEAEYGGGPVEPLGVGVEPQGTMDLSTAGASVLGRTPGLKERGMQVSEGTLEESKRQFDVQEKLNLPVTTGEFAAMEAGLPLVDEQLGFGFSKAATGYINRIKNLTAQGSSRMGLYDHSRENWDYLKKPFIEAAQKEMATAVKNHDMQKVAQLKKSIDLMDKPKFLDMFYPMAARARKTQEAKLAKESDLLLRSQLSQIDNQIKAVDDDINRVELEKAKLDPFEEEAIARLDQEKTRLISRRQALYGYKKALGGKVPEEFLPGAEKSPPTPSPEELGFATEAATLVGDFINRYPTKREEAQKLISGKRTWNEAEVDKIRKGLETLKPKVKGPVKEAPKETKAPVNEETAMKLLRAAESYGRIPKRDEKTWKSKLKAHKGDVWRLIEEEEKALAAQPVKETAPVEAIRARQKQIQQSLGDIGKRIRTSVQQTIRQPEAEEKPWYAK